MINQLKNKGSYSRLLAACGGSPIVWIASFAACGGKARNPHKTGANCRRQ